MASRVSDRGGATEQVAVAPPDSPRTRHWPSFDDVARYFPLPRPFVAEVPLGRRLAYPAGMGSNSIRRTMASSIGLCPCYKGKKQDQGGNLHFEMARCIVTPSRKMKTGICLQIHRKETSRCNAISALSPWAVFSRS